MILEKACQVLEDVIHELTPYTDQIEIAGELRREEESIWMIEVIILPAIENVCLQRDMFGPDKSVTYQKNLLDEWLMTLAVENMVLDPKKPWARANDVENHDDINGQILRRTKPLFHFTGNGTVRINLIVLDHIDQMGAALALGTGPKRIADRIERFAWMKRMSIQDLYLHGHAGSTKENHICSSGNDCILIRPCQTEEDLFEKLGLEYIHPRIRTNKKMQAAERKALGLTEAARWA
jgi:DNA polymerase/3'-5' exonuclease PolX